MNKERSKRIQQLIEKVNELGQEIESIKDEEQDYLDNIPENLQGSERYEKAETAVSELEDAFSNIESVAESLNNAIEC